MEVRHTKDDLDGCWVSIQYLQDRKTDVKGSVARGNIGGAHRNHVNIGISRTQEGGVSRTDYDEWHASPWKPPYSILSKDAR